MTLIGRTSEGVGRLVVGPDPKDKARTLLDQIMKDSPALYQRVRDVEERDLGLVLLAGLDDLSRAATRYAAGEIVEPTNEPRLREALGIIEDAISRGELSGGLSALRRWRGQNAKALSAWLSRRRSPHTRVVEGLLDLGLKRADARMIATAWARLQARSGRGRFLVLKARPKKSRQTK